MPVPLPTGNSGDILATIPEAMQNIALRKAQANQAQANANLSPYEMQLKQAQAQHFMGENERAQQQNPLKMDELKSKIEQQKALTGWYSRRSSTGMSGGVALKDQMALMQQAMKDNPGIDMNRANQITSAWINGEPTLPDGTPVPEASGNSAYLLDVMGRRRTTAPVITQGIQANQAESEMPIFDKYIQEGVQPYGTTVFGASPQQIKDSLNVNNKDAQTRLGNYLASQQLLYDKTALMLKMSGLPPGVTIADEAKKLAAQTINAKYPMLSKEARRIASERVAKALTEGLSARRKVPTGANSITSGNKSKSSVTKWHVENGKLVKE